MTKYEYYKKYINDLIEENQDLNSIIYKLT